MIPNYWDKKYEFLRCVTQTWNARVRVRDMSRHANATKRKNALLTMATFSDNFTKQRKHMDKQKIGMEAMRAMTAELRYWRTDSCERYRSAGKVAPCPKRSRPQ